MRSRQFTDGAFYIMIAIYVGIVLLSFAVTML